MEEKKKMERQDEKGRLAMAENNYGDNTPLHRSQSSFFLRHNGPATAAPVQEGQFWKRSETNKTNSSRSTKVTKESCADKVRPANRTEK